MSAPAPPRRGACRHCRQPITRLWSSEWVHDGRQGTFQCRDTQTGMALPRRAEPVPFEPPAVGRAPVPAGPAPYGRHQAGEAPAWPLAGGAA